MSIGVGIRMELVRIGVEKGLASRYSLGLWSPCYGWDRGLTISVRMGVNVRVRGNANFKLRGGRQGWGKSQYHGVKGSVSIRVWEW